MTDNFNSQSDSLLEDLDGSLILRVSSLKRQGDDDDLGEATLLMSLADRSNDGWTRHIGVATGPGLDLIDKSQLGTNEYKSKTMQDVIKLALNAAKTASTVLLTGESGVGKGHLAEEYIHRHSGRTGKFLSINCAAIPGELAETELFGHEKGAFTGAKDKKLGLLDLAQDGTLLLDEIGELPINIQAKLLTFLDKKKFIRVGGQKVVSADVRLIAATNKNLEQAVKSGSFRQDLYWRIKVVPIKMPPLRERREDIPILVAKLIEQIRSDNKWEKDPDISTRTMADLQRSDWPGNVRELRNVLERALVASNGRRVDIRELGGQPDSDSLDEKRSDADINRGQADNTAPSLADIPWPKGYGVGRSRYPGWKKILELQEDYIKGKSWTWKHLAGELKITVKALRNWRRRAQSESSSTMNPA
jgi:DNA-binding NtrC family response regulator